MKGSHERRKGTFWASVIVAVSAAVLSSGGAAAQSVRIEVQDVKGNPIVSRVTVRRGSKEDPPISTDKDGVHIFTPLACSSTIHFRIKPVIGLYKITGAEWMPCRGSIRRIFTPARSAT